MDAAVQCHPHEQQAAADEVEDGDPRFRRRLARDAATSPSTTAAAIPIAIVAAERTGIEEHARPSGRFAEHEREHENISVVGKNIAASETTTTSA